MAFLENPELPIIFGILGNIVSFLVYLAPLPTFYTICKRKSTEGFQSIPYLVALFSSMLYLYYAFLKQNAIMLITINSVGTFVEMVYITIFMIYATREAKVLTTKLLIGFNIGSLGLIVSCTYFLAHGDKRVRAVGWICASFSLCVFIAPFSIIRRVIKTKSVEYMPVSLSFFLTLCAVVWFFYGLLIHDYYIATPNILGFVFGVIQMILYCIYRTKRPRIVVEVVFLDSTTVDIIATEMKEKPKETVPNGHADVMVLHEEGPGSVLETDESSSKLDTIVIETIV